MPSNRASLQPTRKSYRNLSTSWALHHSLPPTLRKTEPPGCISSARFQDEPWNSNEKRPFERSTRRHWRCLQIGFWFNYITALSWQTMWITWCDCQTVVLYQALHRWPSLCYSVYQIEKEDRRSLNGFVRGFVRGLPQSRRRSANYEERIIEINLYGKFFNILSRLFGWFRGRRRSRQRIAAGCWTAQR